MPTTTLAKTTRQIAKKAPSRDSRAADLGSSVKTLAAAHKAVQALIERHQKGERGKSFDKALAAAIEQCDDASSSLFSAQHPE